MRVGSLWGKKHAKAGQTWKDFMQKHLWYENLVYVVFFPFSFCGVWDSIGGGGVNILHAVSASNRQRGIGYLKILSGSLDIMYTPSQKVLQCRREFSLPWIHNTPQNIWVLAFTHRKHYAKQPCLRCQLFSAPPHLVETQFLEYRPTSSKSALLINVKKQLGYLTKLSVSSGLCDDLL